MKEEELDDIKKTLPDDLKPVFDAIETVIQKSIVDVEIKAKEEGNFIRELIQKENDSTLKTVQFVYNEVKKIEDKYDRGVSLSNGAKTINLRGIDPNGKYGKNVKKLIMWASEPGNKLGF